jgi:hypothetical protein
VDVVCVVVSLKGVVSRALLLPLSSRSCQVFDRRSHRRYKVQLASNAASLTRGY